MSLQRRSLRAAAALAVAVVVFTGGTARSSAGPVDDKKAQAARLAAQIDATAQRIAGVVARLNEAKAKLAATDAALAQATGMLGAANGRFGEVKGRLARQAVDAYVHGGSIAIVQQLADSRGQDLPVRNHYASLAAGEDRAVADELVAARQDLGIKRGSLQRLQADRRASVAALDGDVAALAKTEASMRALLARVNGQLAALVAADQARRDAARRSRGGRPSGTWDCIRQLESGNNYNAPGGGAYQFMDSTWHALGYSGTASDAPPEQQDAAAVQLQQRAGWGQWTTASRCGR
jgi:septal ring factor EnvC (AmiA/AmiB activator)